MIANKSEKVTCPFNVAHTIERRRLQTHIIKCKRTLPSNHTFVSCPFWELHYVKKHELEDHKLTCEHRLLKEANKRMWDNPDALNNFSEPKLLVDPAAQSYVNNESWEDVGPSFKAEELHASTSHMVTPQGMTKSQRRDYREKERQRLRDLEETTVKIDKTNKTFAQPASFPEELSPPRKREKIVYDLGASPADKFCKNPASTLIEKERLANVTGWNNNGSGRKPPFCVNSEDEFPCL